MNIIFSISLVFDPREILVFTDYLNPKRTLEKQKKKTILYIFFLNRMKKKSYHIKCWVFTTLAKEERKKDLYVKSISFN